LANEGERVALLNGCGALVDEVRYFAGGQWPGAADGEGPSLELRNPTADNAAPAAWAAPGALGDWVELAWRGPAGQSAVGPDGHWQELVLGLLDAGEVLIDDVSVIHDPDGAATELIDGGDFSVGPGAWRLIGTHRDSEVIADPDDPENAVLRLVATGPTEHMHNHAEITLAGDHAIDPAAEYAVRLRARWVHGSGLLYARLYFNRLAHTTRLPRPVGGGTPGAPNRSLAPLGPTCLGLTHAPAVPAPGAAAGVRVDLSDPEGVATATLFTSVEGAPFEATPMAETQPGRFEAPLPTDEAGARVQYYVLAQDTVGTESLCPPGGPASRALMQVEDGRWPADAPLPPLRLILTPADDALLHAEVELMSNDRLGATVIDGDGHVFHGVGVRLKGSQRGRPSRVRLGYSLGFDPADLFRGVYSTVSIDRSEGTRYGQREMLIDLVMAHAGSVSAEYNDLGWLVSPRAEHQGPAQLQLARFGDLMLGNQFADGEDGRLYEYELVYFPTTTDDGTPTGRKRPQPDQVLGTRLRSLGEDPEAYRHTFLVKNNRGADDFAAIIAFAQVFGLPDDAFRAQVEAVIDVDQWLRAFAFSALAGAIDHYAGGAQHNVQFYVRPEDERVLFFPHDLDFYPGNPNAAVVGSNDLRRLLAVPAWRRAFYGHLLSILQTSYNEAWLSFWRDHLGALLPGQDFASHHQFMVQRAQWVMHDAPDAVTQAIPPVPFEVFTEGPLAGPEAVIEGQGWLDLQAIHGPDGPLVLEWPTETTWRATVAVPAGAPTLRLTAHGFDGVLAEVDLPVE
ncbi:MAG: CotH kinase family protein, partial [Myxococcales bacterium]|nr:CotH kinase family protein [Myxococcales bacterium]